MIPKIFFQVKKIRVLTQKYITGVFIKDVSLNLLATIISVMVAQLIVYPFLNRIFGKSNFGEILTIMGIVNIVGAMFGNSLNNVRLIQDKTYKEEKYSGDFMLLLLISCIANILIIGVSFFFFQHEQNLVNTIIIILISLLTLLRSYLTVSYRLEINFKLLLTHSIIYALALIAGSLILNVIEIWPIPFLIGEIISIVYLLKTTSLMKEPLRKTPKFTFTSRQYIHLTLTSFIANVLVYLDRLIILPLIGEKPVAIYFAATTIGKMSNLVLQPFSSVLLTYFSKSRKKMEVFEFWLINGCVLVISGITLIACVLFSKIFILKLYPNLYHETLSILFIANAAAILSASGSITQAILLKYCNISWQMFIQIIYGAIYIGLGILFTYSNGLIGFSFAALLASVVRFLLMLSIGSISIKRLGNGKEMRAN